MPEAAENDARHRAETQILSPAEQMKTMKKPWLRMDSEKTLWFNRFKRYLDLGPKRSLLAALEQEQQSVKALKSTKEEQKPAGGRAGVKKVSSLASKGKAHHLVEVAKPRPQVPGSWKQACADWCWVERARAYDSWRIDLVAEKHINETMTEAAIGVNRVRTLKNLLAVTQDIFNRNINKMSFEQANMYLARMQSIMKDIREEMAAYEPAAARLLMENEVQQLYDHATPEEGPRGRTER